MALFGLVTSVLCMLTPICPFSIGTLPVGIRRELFGNVNKSNSNLDETVMQRIRRATEMVSNALDKYEKLQKTFKTS